MNESELSHPLAQTPLISVCVCTYHRPELLEGLLLSVVAQRDVPGLLEVIVVDNDRAGSARLVCDSVMTQFPQMQLVYAIEANQGISHARNRSVGLARGRVIAFIDDDETATPNWLMHLYSTLEDTQADAVFGPVIPVYPAGTAKWVVRSGLFERPRFPTGTLLHCDLTRTSNAMVRADWCRRRGDSCFDLKYSHSGGEDHDFFRWMQEQDARFVSSDEASVEELVPLERQRLSFILERRLRSSITYWQGVNRPLPGRVIHALAGASAGLLLLVGGAAVWCADKALGARLLVKGVKGCGRLLALSDLRLHGYRSKNA